MTSQQKTGLRNLGARNTAPVGAQAKAMQSMLSKTAKGGFKNITKVKGKISRKLNKQGGLGTNYSR